MNLTKIFMTCLIGFVVFAVLFIIMLKIIGNFLLLQHEIHVIIDNKKMQENFSLVTDMNGTIKDISTQQTCENKSLNDMHKLGTVPIRPNIISCDGMNNKENETDFFKKYETPAIYEQNSGGILGANYMMYNDKPNPYHLDFALYDKSAPNNTPVGTNFSFNA